MPRKKPESPVNVGDSVFYVNLIHFDVREGIVTDNPSDHLWVRPKDKEHAVSFFIGPHRWDSTKNGARKKALELATSERSKVAESLDFLDKRIKQLGGK